jgi:hypothetical protein
MRFAICLLLSLFATRSSATTSCPESVSRFTPQVIAETHDPVGTLCKAFTVGSRPFLAVLYSNAVGASLVVITVGSIVGGYYVRDSRSDDVSVAIYPPNDHFLTGGGFLSPTTSAGAIGADAGTKVHFTVDARLKGSQPAIEGRVSVSLQHTDEMARRHSYAVEVRTLGSFATNPEATRAVITGMATTITDVSDPAHPVVLATNGLLELTTTQASAGHDAKLALTLWKADGGLWFTNSWHSTEAVEEPLAGGAIQIH